MSKCYDGGIDIALNNGTGFCEHLVVLPLLFLSLSPFPHGFSSSSLTLSTTSSNLISYSVLFAELKTFIWYRFVTHLCSEVICESPFNETKMVNGKWKMCHELLFPVFIVILKLHSTKQQANKSETKQ